ncbi:MAG: CdaR family protein [Salibacteraceae bacterium]|nr:CdaR family protein [Salibacteraceae bacterium]
MAKESFFSIRDIIRDRRKLTVFSICVVISLFMWLLISLGKEYNTTILVPIKYINFPENKTLVNDISNQLAVNVSGTGYDLIKYDGSLTDDTLVINLNNLKISVIGGFQQGSLDPAMIGKDLQEKLNGMLAINHVLTDSLKFVFDLKVTRFIAIKPIVQYTLPNGYVLLDSVITFPNEIQVTGALSILDTLAFVQTDTLKLGELSYSQNRNVSISRRVIGSDAAISIDSVQMMVNIDQLTEKTFLIEPTKLNVPDSINLLLFPSSVEVIMQVPLSRYDEIMEDGIQLEVDFNDFDPAYPTLPLKLQSWPVQAQKIKLKDERVEMVITKSSE